jgi:hypothetical protein
MLHAWGIVRNGLYYLRSKLKGEKMLKVLIAGLFTLVLVASATCPQGERSFIARRANAE